MHDKELTWGFPGDPAVKKLPCNVGVTGSIPGLERSHMPPRHNHRVRTGEPSSCNYEPTSLCVGALQQEEPSQREASVLQLEKA